MAMTMNCDTANKLVKRLVDEQTSILEKEANSMVYMSTMADEEKVRPEYDFIATQKKLNGIMEMILTIKHAINDFNVNTVIPCGYSIDQALVAMTILNKQKSKLEKMRKRQEITKRTSYGGEDAYEFANFDRADAEDEYRRVSKKLMEIQSEINTVNITKTFDVYGINEEDISGLI